MPYCPERRHKYKLRYDYGITVQDYDDMMERQLGRCAICASEKVNGPGKRLHVDHCHSTGTVRGLLCAACNKALGGFREDITLLKTAIYYLENDGAR